MTSKEQSDKSLEEKMKREREERLAQVRAQRSPNQQRLFEKMGIVLRIKKPE